jgi:hypothetical protein
MLRDVIREVGSSRRFLLLICPICGREGDFRDGPDAKSA